MRDETLDPRALSIPANSMAIYPAPTTATFLGKKKKNIYIYNNIISYIFHVTDEENVSND